MLYIQPMNLMIRSHVGKLKDPLFLIKAFLTVCCLSLIFPSPESVFICSCKVSTPVAFPVEKNTRYVLIQVVILPMSSLRNGYGGWLGDVHIQTPLVFQRILLNGNFWGKLVKSVQIC